MISNQGRARAAFARYASAVFVLAVLIVCLASVAQSATAPKIISVDIVGNTHVPSSEILPILEAKPGERYSPKLISADLARLNAMGYFADVAPPLIRERPNGLAITYRVVENPVITKIVFHGNKHVPSDTLLALMDTSVGQVFNTNTFRQDVLKINSYYERIGYSGQLPTHVKDLHLDPKTGVLTLQVQEGLTIRRILIGGDPILPPAAILPKLAAKPGVEYSNEMRSQDAKAIEKIYKKYNLIVGRFEGGIDPGSINLKNDSANVKYDIWVAKVGAVQITGNTKTKDQVIRRLLTLKPGMIITRSAIKQDYERLQNTGFFSKVNFNPKAGPNPKRPQDITINWQVTEQRTATASVGFGYSGGIMGQGLYGTVGYTDSNLHGTGNGVQVNFQRGVRTYVSQLSATIPYVGDTPQSQKYSLSATLFANGSTYYYPIYPVSTQGTIAPAPAIGGTPAPVPVTLYSNGLSSPIGGTAATSTAKAAGLTVQVGRRLNYYTQLLLGASGQTISNSTIAPSPYFFQGGQPNVLVGPTPNPLTSNITTNGSFGIAASSIANVNTGMPYRLTYLNFGVQTDTRNNIFNPRHGMYGSLMETISSPGMGSSFKYTKSLLNAAKFIPVLKDATLALHGEVGLTTGTIPPSELFTFDDQVMRGYNSVFYGTDYGLAQVELRQPIALDRKLTLALFVDQLRYRIRGAVPLLNPFTNRVVGYPGNWTNLGDYGFGFRFDLPQLGIHTVRIDFGRGQNGWHTSFGIGQSF
ncbi:MAG: BamA/OMP85 family outer membrane protein [Vulcanimicrobiaceae bacterium]